MGIVNFHRVLYNYENYGIHNMWPKKRSAEKFQTQ